MSMIKLIVPGAQQFGDKVSQLVKVANRGMRGNDLDAFVKRAGHQFVDALRNIDLRSGEVPIHMLAVGSTESYGPNRNGDGFKEATCRTHHSTFVKHARWYRNHQNKDTKKSYGTVKLSAMNDRMKRIELIVALNGTKEAAERNGGLVADKELEKLANSDDNWGVSMACRVPFDVCSGCGNQAHNRGEYCTEKTCKYGGLMHNITKVAGDGHVLHADNPDPTFFDISDVYRPADRIAWVLGHAKAASGVIPSGAELAEEAQIRYPYAMLTSSMSPAVAGEVKLAYELAELEQRIHRDPVSMSGDLTRAFEPTLQPPIEGIDGYAKLASRRAQALNALAGQKICLSVRDYLCFAFGESSEKTAQLSNRVIRHLPGIYGRLIASDDLESLLASNSHSADREVAPLNTRQWAEKQAAAHSLSAGHVEQRVVRSALRELPVPRLRGPEKIAADSQAEDLARRYALYKLAFLRYWAGDIVDAPRLSELAIRQNYAG